jgi:tRNA/tmRNA/rRNA uracil-C5-methylase (TrmA/RlmC/RlmD family)
MTEHLSIVRIGHRGDGIADAPAPIYVPYTLPGETVEVEDWPGHPDRRRLLRVEATNPDRIARSVRLVSAAAAPCSTDVGSLSRVEARPCGLRRLTPQDLLNGR